MYAAGNLIVTGKGTLNINMDISGEGDEITTEYGELKEKLALRYPYDIDGYWKIKKSLLSNSSETHLNGIPLKICDKSSTLCRGRKCITIGNQFYLRSIGMILVIMPFFILKYRGWTPDFGILNELFWYIYTLIR